MRPNRFCLLALLVWLALCAPAFAQDPNAMPEDYKRERVQELIVMRLNNELGLNPSQSQQIAQILRKYHQERAGLRRHLQIFIGKAVRSEAARIERETGQPVGDVHLDGDRSSLDADQRGAANRCEHGDLLVSERRGRTPG